MKMTETVEEKHFREEVRTWLEQKRPRDQRPEKGAPMRAFDLAWQRAQYEGGWAGISWPKEHGGRGLSLRDQIIWHEEYAAANAPPVGCLFVALNHGGPTLIARGDPTQQSVHLPKILRGESVWCQGFSEPGAGSDLAALRASGRIEGDELVLNGQKVWTSYGQVADFQEMLVRTEAGSARHKGISWVICPMDTPGVTVQPITTLSGSEHFCEVFYDNVRIPLSSVVGGLHNGWSVAMTTLSFERGIGLIGWQQGLAKTVERLLIWAKDRYGDLDNSPYALRISMVRSEVNALRAMTQKLIGLVESGGGTGAEGTVVGLFFGELARRVYELALDLRGLESIERTASEDDWTTLYLESFRYSIAGGTSQVRRNIIGERMLGLPKDAR